MITADELIKKIMNYYDVANITELSKKIGIGQPAISKWRKNNSIETIERKCKELGIYDIIFSKVNSKMSFNQEGDHNTQIGSIKSQYNNSQNKEISGEKEKIYNNEINDEIVNLFNMINKLTTTEEQKIKFRKHLKKFVVELFEDDI